MSLKNQLKKSRKNCLNNRILPTLSVGDNMRVLKILLTLLCILLIFAATVAEVVLAEAGCKEIGGSFEGNTAFEVSTDENYYYITLLNEKITLRRF